MDGGGVVAIGSDTPIGETFGLWGEMTPEQQQAWWDKIRTDWADTLMAGYATIAYPSTLIDPDEQPEDEQEADQPPHVADSISTSCR